MMKRLTAVCVTYLCAFVATVVFSSQVTAQTVPPPSLGAPQSGGGTAVNRSDRRATLSAKGKAVSVNGSRNRLTITRNCPQLAVSGNNNTIYIDTVADIIVPGSKNKIYWRRSLTKNRAPRINNLGKGNTIIRWKK